MDSRKCIHVDSDEIRFGENLMWNLKQPEIPRRTDET